MCCVHSWSRLDVDLWPPGQFYRLLSCLHVQPVTSVSFDIGIPYLAHGSITKRGCVKYIHDPDMTLTFDLKVKFIGFMTWLCVQASPFLSFGIVILCYACGCITMVRCVTYSHELCMTLTLISKLYFHNVIEWIKIWQDVFALWHRHTKFLHMGVSLWDMLCTFSTLVWLWPLIYRYPKWVLLSVFFLFNIRNLIFWILKLSFWGKIHIHVHPKWYILCFVSKTVEEI